jgi:putative flippase GtrA
LGTIRDLYQRFRQLIHEGFKFLVVGAIGTFVTFGAANALHGIGKYKAITIATVLATIVTYLGNRYWSFSKRQGQGTARESIIFLVLNGIGLLIYYGCIWLIQDVAGLQGKGWYNLALVVGTGLGTLFRFWSYRKWVWTEPGSQGSAGWADGTARPAPEAPGSQLGFDPPAAEELPADSPSPVRQPWSGPKHRAPAARR